MLNKVTLIGRLCADPEVKYMPNGTAVAQVSIATSRRYKDKQSGEKKEDTEFHRVVFFSRLAEIAGEYLKKGVLVYVEGRLKTRKWQGQDGHDRYTTEIIAESMHMLGSKSQPEGGQAPQRQQKSSNTIDKAPQSMNHDQDQYADFDDDIPF